LGTKIVVRSGETIGEAVRRFKRQVEKTQDLSRVKRIQKGFVGESEKRRRKRYLADKRREKCEALNNPKPQ
jgi:ribosomal protein S21